MESQTILNVAYGAVCMLLGWILNGLRQSVNSLHESDKQLADKVQNIEVLVAGDYVRRDEMERMIARGNAPLAEQLKRIEKILDK